MQNRATRYFFDVHKKAPIHALQADMGWVNVKYHFYLCAVLLAVSKSLAISKRPRSVQALEMAWPF